MFAHALPNVLLLFNNGKKQYKDYGNKVRNLDILPVFHVLLCTCFIVHIGLAFKAFLNKYSHGVMSLSILQITGGIILMFLISHLIDFRFNDLENIPLDKMLTDVLKQNLKKIWYMVGIVATGLHAFKGVSILWLSRLDFNAREAQLLIPIGRVLVILSTCLYIIPVVLIK